MPAFEFVYMNSCFFDKKNPIFLSFSVLSAVDTIEQTCYNKIMKQALTSALTGEGAPECPRLFLFIFYKGELHEKEEHKADA